MKPEEKARHKIDQMLEAAGWTVQDVQELNLSASPGVAVREFPMENGAADYLLFADRMAIRIVEAKPEGTTLSGVADQSGKYIAAVPENLPHVEGPLPFTYESTGVETFFMWYIYYNPRAHSTSHLPPLNHIHSTGVPRNPLIRNIPHHISPLHPY
jgi:type I restriction enzyme R subunit